jgi:hypothetical protein
LEVIELDGWWLRANQLKFPIWHAFSLQLKARSPLSQLNLVPIFGVSLVLLRRKTTITNSYHERAKYVLLYTYKACRSPSTPKR